MQSYACTHAAKLYNCSVLDEREASSSDPVYHQDRASPLPYLRGKAYGLAGSVKPGPRLYPPSQLLVSESQAEQTGGPLETLGRATVRGRGIDGQEPTYCVHSLSLSHHFTQPSPILACSSFILQLTDSVHFFFILCSPVSRAVSSLSFFFSTAPLNRKQAQFNKVSPMTTSILYIRMSV